MLRQGPAARDDGIYVQQLVITFREPLDPEILLRSWDRIVRRHAILRTTFHVRASGEMIQQVASDAAVPVHREDWSGPGCVDSAQRLKDFLKEDRRRGFEPIACPERIPTPLWRLGLFRCGVSDWRCVWTSHHALLDGRSRRRLLEEWLGLYDALVQGIEPVFDAPPRPFAEHSRWLAAQDCSGSRGFFEELLRGVAGSTPLPMARRIPQGSGSEPRHGTLDWTLDPAVTARLKRCAADWGVSVHTLVQGAWAVLLGRYADEDDVVFGGVRACRHSGPSGTDTTVGLLINTLPVRVRLPAAMPVREWMKSLRDQWRALREHETTPLAQIHAWSGTAPGEPLFESVVMFENSLRLLRFLGR